MLSLFRIRVIFFYFSMQFNFFYTKSICLLLSCLRLLLAQIYNFYVYNIIISLIKFKLMSFMIYFSVMSHDNAFNRICISQIYFFMRYKRKKLKIFHYKEKEERKKARMKNLLRRKIKEEYKIYN